MSNGIKIENNLFLDRTTKGTVVYVHPFPEVAAVRTLYISKSQFPAPYPEAIKVTIEVADKKPSAASTSSEGQPG